MPEFRIIGYATAASVPEIIPYNKLTHINYAFLIPNVDGAFEPPPNLWKLERIVELAHQSGTRVLISVGGWGWDAEFERLAASPRARAALVEGLVSFVEQYSLDGVDMDWEYPDPGESAANFLALMSELRAALPEGKLLTAAVIAYGDEYGMGVPADAIPLLDFINLMAYDGDDHGTMSQSEQALDYWLGRGFASSQVVLGVPFYARPSETPYRKIVEQDPAAAQLDEFDYFGVMIHYNGIPTIQEKTRLALARGSGIMFWTLDHDIQGEFSLVEAIYQAAHAP
jgi:GH18 family chitinase